MKSIKLEISQSEVQPGLLFWKMTSNSISVSGVLQIESDNESARFLACAAHAFKSSGLMDQTESMPSVKEQ